MGWVNPVLIYKLYRFLSKQSDNYLKVGIGYRGEFNRLL